MQTATKSVRSILLSTLLGLSGCFSLSQGTPIQQHYVLGEGPRPESAAPLEDSSATIIGLRTPQMADYLASPFIVVRQGTHRIGFSEFDRWGEDLARGINRAVAGHIAMRAPSLRVETAPWPLGTAPDFLIQLHFLRFEGVAPEDSAALEGEAHLLANWEILRSDDGALLRRGITEIRSPGWTVGDFDALVGLLDAGLAVLAEELVLGVESVRLP